MEFGFKDIYASSNDKWGYACVEAGPSEDVRLYCPSCSIQHIVGARYENFIFFK